MKKHIVSAAVVTAFLTASMLVLGCNESTSNEISASNEIEYTHTLLLPDMLIYECVEELMGDTHHIIRGKVLDKRFEWRNPFVSREVSERELAQQGMTEEEIEYELKGITFEGEPELTTIYRVQVLEVFQERYELGETIEFVQRGGEYGNERWVTEGIPKLEIGSEFILFLYSWHYWGEIGSPHALTSSIQGLYHVPNEVKGEESIIDFYGKNIALETASETIFLLDLSIDDLVTIARKNGLID